MIRVRNNEVRAYFCKVTMTTTDGTQVIYTDTPSEYQEMVGKFPHILKVDMENVVLDEEQQKRLNAVIDIKSALEEKWELQVSNFVKDGYLVPADECKDCGRVKSPLEVLLPKYESVSKNTLVNTYKEKLAEIRYNKEVGGCSFNGMIAFTDKQAQSSISNTVLTFQVTGMESTRFKFVDGWQILTYDQLVLLAKRVAYHVQICFNAEEIIGTRLAMLSNKELCGYSDNPYGVPAEADAKEPKSLQEEYDAEITKLEAAFESTYKVSLK